MTVRELIALLSQENGDDLVILAKDEEGNEFSPLAEVSTGAYIADSTWSGEVKLRELTEELVKDGWTEEDVGTPEEGAQPCITLWPVN